MKLVRFGLGTSLAKLNQATLTPLANFGLHDAASPTAASVGPPELPLELLELEPLELPELELLELELAPLELELLDLPELEPLEAPELELLELELLVEPLVPLDELECPLELPELELLEPELVPLELELLDLPELEPLEAPELELLELELAPLDAPEPPLELPDAPASLEGPGDPLPLSSSVPPHPKAATVVITKAALETIVRRMGIPFVATPRAGHGIMRPCHLPQIRTSINRSYREYCGFSRSLASTRRAGEVLQRPRRGVLIAHRPMAGVLLVGCGKGDRGAFMETATTSKNASPSERASQTVGILHAHEELPKPHGKSEDVGALVGLL
ncbi:MAG: hypothetical protein ABTD50_16660 [Polyangiaceae bacterium]